MRLIYNLADGEIFNAVPDRDWFMFSHTINVPIGEFEIDEVAPTNQTVCQEVVKSLRCKDVDGFGKYYISGGSLMEREGWSEHVEAPV